MNPNELIFAINKELNFIKGNPDVMHDIRVESANRAIELLNKLKSHIPNAE